MKQSLTRRSLKNTRRRRIYLATASLAALVMAAGGTAMAVQPNDEPDAEPKTTNTAPAAAFAGETNTEEWAGNASSLYQKYARGGSSVTGGVNDAAAKDGKALNLTIPAGAGASPSNAAEVASKEQFLYGSFSSRVKTADCSAQPETGAVTGIFTYGNDGTDQDGDGLTDNSEIDIEVLCGRPDVINLTIYTDYEASTEKSQRVSRIVDLRQGKVISTCYYTDFSGNCVENLTGEQSSPATVPAIKDFDSSKAYYDYRIDWTEQNVKFTITDEAGEEITLWDYQGPAERIPSRPAGYLVNFWHTNSWAAHERPKTIKSPTAPLTVSVDSSTSTALD
ncbi:glycoside hydrolase family 16 protein [Kineosporia babensis]|uniref:Glycoside hydrolase family 16 protein n=1 Tax=Kineosporia babensis TaxID=499548 RepID=A0A9X1N9V6_9ACTN|nr:glycoside hydrolase family 16 protein [Kineosporia babensis]MCD5309381.1 glycoside hydrolase family 16 protein [Kineosporia babensis]